MRRDHSGKSRQNASGYGQKSAAHLTNTHPVYLKKRARAWGYAIKALLILHYDEKAGRSRIAQKWFFCTKTHGFLSEMRATYASFNRSPSSWLLKMRAPFFFLIPGYAVIFKPWYIIHHAVNTAISFAPRTAFTIFHGEYSTSFGENYQTIITLITLIT